MLVSRRALPLPAVVAFLTVDGLGWLEFVTSFSTGGAAFSTGGAAFSTGGAAFSAGGAAFSTGGAAFSTGGAVFSTDCAAFSTGGAAFSTGGAALDWVESSRMPPALAGIIAEAFSDPRTSSSAGGPEPVVDRVASAEGRFSVADFWESTSAPLSRDPPSGMDACGTGGGTTCGGATRQRQVNSPVSRSILRNALRKSARSIKFSASKCPTPNNTSALDGSSLSWETKSANRFSRSPPST